LFREVLKLVDDITTFAEAQSGLIIKDGSVAVDCGRTIPDEVCCAIDQKIGAAGSRSGKTIKRREPPRL